MKLLKKEYPIIEFDGMSNNLIDANSNMNSSYNVPLPECCIISFFGDTIKKYVEDKKGKVINELTLESINIPIYGFDDEKNICVLHGLGSGPYAAGQMEKLIAMGCRKFFVCGGCGVLESGSKCGDIFIPISALRDEGTSYHYMAPSRTIELDTITKDIIGLYLFDKGIDFQYVKTWTTDAIYRETEDLVELRRQEGCKVVEMECASYLAVAKYKSVKFGQLLYAGDDLSGERWESRDWKKEKETRRKLLELSIEICKLI